MDLEKIEKEVLWWNRAAVVLPIVSTAILFLLYRLNFAELYILFYIALSLYIVTAITWWWWTMKNIVYLTKLLTRTTDEIKTVVDEVKDMRNTISNTQKITNNES